MAAVAVRAGRIGAEQKIGLVLQDHARVKLLHALAVGFVIVADELDLVVLAARLDTSGSVHLIAPEFEAAVLLQGVHIHGPRVGDGETNGEVLGKTCSDEERNKQKDGENESFHGSPSRKALGWLKA